MGQRVVGVGKSGVGGFVVKKQGSLFGFGSTSFAPNAVGRKDGPRATQLRQSLVSSGDS